MNKIKNIAVIASNDKKTDLIEWSYFNREVLSKHNILAYAEAANILEGTLNTTIRVSEAGKAGELTELCNLIDNNAVDAVVIFTDPSQVFHNKGLAAIIEVANRQNIVLATNRTTADFVVNSKLIENDYKKTRDEKKITDNKPLNPGFNYPLAKAS